MAAAKKQTPSSKKQESFNFALASAAFQDHLLKSMGPINPNLRPPIPSHRRTPAAKKTSSKAAQQNASSTSQNTAPNEEKEYVIDQKKVDLSLAQRMGLCDVPELPLTEREWLSLKEKAQERSEFTLPCVICKEELGARQEVLLSCSHVFHLTCLQAFERFSGKKSCPVCRKVEYQKRVVHEAAKGYREKCATKIQALWRGYVVRKWYKQLRLTVPPKNPKLRRKFFEEKLHSITDRIVQSCNFDINQFFRSIDDDVERSRQILHAFEHKLHFVDECQWHTVEQKALSREHLECPICMVTIDPTKTPQRPITLLSCSHIFHKVCIEAMEDLCTDGRHSCPMCRSAYQKKHLDSFHLESH